MEDLLNKPIFQATLGELVEAIRIALREEERADEPQLVYGIAGLASILGCSVPTAQKIKNSGKIPFMQQGRKVVFEVSKVLKAIEK